MKYERKTWTYSQALTASVGASALSIVLGSGPVFAVVFSFTVWIGGTLAYDGVCAILNRVEERRKKERTQKLLFALAYVAVTQSDPDGGPVLAFDEVRHLERIGFVECIPYKHGLISYRLTPKGVELLRTRSLP